MNFFDSAIIDSCQQLSNVSWIFDATVNFISENHLIKGGALLAILWWGWFKADEKQRMFRMHMLATLIACLVGIALARSLALILPFRCRPMHDTALKFLLPHTMNPRLATGWSSFPSDHAVLFYALAAGFFYISRKLGIAALIYVTIFVGLPRIYLGLHYPTDIIGGAVVGAGIVLFCNIPFFIRKIFEPVLNWAEAKPEFFYPLFFLISYQIADMFDNCRSFISLLVSIARAFK